jgi:hypothetical protein
MNANKNLTHKQAARFASVEAKLPEGYSYSLHNESDAGFRDQPVWGVTLYGPGESSLGYVSKPDARGWVNANRTKGREDTELQQLLLNRVSAALWHRQPVWSAAS